MEEVSAFAAYNATKKRKEKSRNKFNKNKSKHVVRKVTKKQAKKRKLWKITNNLTTNENEQKSLPVNVSDTVNNNEERSDENESPGEQSESNSDLDTRIGPIKNVDMEATDIVSEGNFSEGEQSDSFEYKDEDSVSVGENIFKWIIQPVDISQFFNDYWEKRPCLISRNDPSYFSNLFSFSTISEMLVKNHVEFTKNIDITSYIGGERQTHNPEGRALPPDVWNFYAQGCSIRILNPQTFVTSIYSLNSSLQEYFHCMVGANVYLTPPNSQGFAPHYDDIEAFVLQIEGQKHWKLYNPRSKEEKLPRFSSRNFRQEEIGEPILDKVLKPGDILYFPRGTIHQAFTEGNQHSLHITLSVYQKNSYADLFEKMLPLMLSKAISNNVELRRGLPPDIWYNFGAIISDKGNERRQGVIQNCWILMQKILKEMLIDEAVDELAKRFMHDALPPEITPREKTRHVLGNKVILDQNGDPFTNCTITLESKVRLLRANILRLVKEEDEIRLYFYSDNSKEYHEYEANFIEIGTSEARIVELLNARYPRYVKVSDFPTDLEDDKVNTAQEFWNRGFIILEKPAL